MSGFMHPALRGLRGLLPAAGIALALLAGGCATPPPAGPLKVTVLALNDFHGNLLPPGGGLSNAVRRTPTPAGGAAVLATALAEERQRNPHHVFVAAGDLVGASPLVSALMHDEPTLDVLGKLGLEASAMGNHELDKGAAEALRQQNGGCHPKDGCKGPQPYTGATFRYLAANTVVNATGQTLFPPYWIKRFDGVPVAFIGLTLKDTPKVVAPAGVAGLSFRDEADTVNALVPELKRQGVEAIVVLMHEGGFTSGDINDCTDLRGEITSIVPRLDKAVDVVVSGHTHWAYNCRIDGRLVTSAHRFGTVLTRIELTLDRTTRDVVSSAAENLPLVPTRYIPDAATAGLIATYERIVAPLAKRPVSRLVEPLLVRTGPNGENTIGRLVADAQLEATRASGAQAALMNLGGIRAQLGRDDRLDVTYEDLYAVQPFNNQLVTLTLSGAQILAWLEQQWNGDRGRLMQVSTGFNYAWDGTRPAGSKVVPGSVSIGGRALDTAAEYRITVNNFMADGGDGYTVLRQARNRQYGPQDLEALEAYLAARPLYAPDPQPRIRRIDEPR